MNAPARHARAVTDTDLPLLTVAEVAAMLHVPGPTVYSWVRTGRLPCFRLGSLVRFARGDVLRWLAERKEGSRCRDH